MNEWNEHKLDRELEALMKEMPEQEEMTEQAVYSMIRSRR